MVITRIGPLSLAKIAGVLYAAIGLVVGAIVALVAVAGLAGGAEAGSAVLGSALGLGAIVLLPILYGGLGFVVTLIGAALFNLAAGFVGGVEIDVK
jgi:hypothetical protein